jgi:ABC-2 type transport system ATP-binding protein
VNAGDPIIVTAGLTKVYPSPSGPLSAVDHLDMTIGAGEIYGLLGPNGAGKTTTIGMLTTRVIPTTGTAMVGGVDVIAHPALAKQVIGVVPQTNTLDRAMTVAENLEFHGRYFGMSAKTARAATASMLERIRLAERATAPVVALSGGMAQRLMVARAILHRPQVLFLDEPTAGLDPQSRLALWDLLGELHREGQTILLTTHYMEEADKLKRSVGAGSEVRISVEDGDLAALAAALPALVTGATGARVSDGKVRLDAVDAKGLLPRVITACDRLGYTVIDLSVTEPTLETVFINLTGKDLRE